MSTEVKTRSGELASSSPRPPTVGSALRARLAKARSKPALVAVMILLGAFATTQSSVFLTWGNVQNILDQSAIDGLLAVGMTMVMVSGGIDLSIGSSVSASGMLMGLLMAHGWNPALAVAIGIAGSIVAGAGAGTLAAKARSHPFIVTLGLLTLLQGVALLIGQQPISNIPISFVNITNPTVLGLPVIVVVWLVVAAVVQVVLGRTKFGRWLYAIGGSESAARLSGIRIGWVKVGVYTFNGCIVGIAAALLLAQLSSAQPTAGSGLELAAIAAVAIGGTPLSGGRGDVWGTLLGVLLLGLVSNALNLLSVTSNLQYVVQGAVIIVAVMAQRS